MRAGLPLTRDSENGCAAVVRREWATARLERRHYHADYFCYSWHMDLDCKLAAYGIYLGFVIDGDSRMVLHAAVLPDKTACRVYEELFRPAVATWGFPDQLNTDQGEEWRLCEFVCFFLFGGRLGARLQPVGFRIRLCRPRPMCAVVALPSFPYAAAPFIMHTAPPPIPTISAFHIYMIPSLCTDTE